MQACRKDTVKQTKRLFAVYEQVADRDTGQISSLCIAQAHPHDAYNNQT